MTGDRHCIITADYTSFRHIQGRKVLQIICEIPIEQASDFLTKFGVPNAHEGVPVALSRLTEGAEAKAKTPKERRDWSELTCAQQAGIRCGEEAFMLFLGECHPFQWQKVYKSYDSQPEHFSTVTAETVRRICKVKSRADLDDTDPGGPWPVLDAEYRKWLAGRKAEGQYADELSKPEPEGDRKAVMEQVRAKRGQG